MSPPKINKSLYILVLLFSGSYITLNNQKAMGFSPWMSAVKMIFHWDANEIPVSLCEWLWLFMSQEAWSRNCLFSSHEL